MNTGLIVEIAASQVGVLEHGGNNRGDDVEKYQRATWLQPGPWPWCAAWTCWVMRTWLEDERVLESLTLSPKEAEAWRCKHADAYGWETWGRRKPSRVQLLDEHHHALPGDFVTYDFSHIGIVEKDCGNTIRTIEANTNGRGERDSLSGDGVWRKERQRSLVKTFIRIIPCTSGL